MRLPAGADRSLAAAHFARLSPPAAAAACRAKGGRAALFLRIFTARRHLLRIRGPALGGKPCGHSQPRLDSGRVERRVSLAALDPANALFLARIAPSPVLRALAGARPAGIAAVPAASCAPALGAASRGAARAQPRIRSVLRARSLRPFCLPPACARRRALLSHGSALHPRAVACTGTPDGGLRAAPPCRFAARTLCHAVGSCQCAQGANPNPHWSHPRGRSRQPPALQATPESGTRAPHSGSYTCLCPSFPPGRPSQTPPSSLLPTPA